jgi:hypothetical protein
LGLGACSLGNVGLSLPGSAPEPGPLELPVPDALSTPDQQKLVPRVEALFKELKLVGTPEMSRLRRAPTLAQADWMFCLRGSTSEKPGPYAIFVDKSAVVHYRAAVKLDECERDRYEPLANFAAPAPPSPRG